MQNECANNEQDNKLKDAPRAAVTQWREFIFCVIRFVH